jgi:hypothetical protein
MKWSSRVILVVLTFSVCASGLNLTDIRVRTRTYWGQLNAANSNLPDSIVNNATNTAQALVAHVGQAREMDTSITLTTTATSYSLPSDFDGVVGVFGTTRTVAPAVLRFMPYREFTMGYADKSPSEYSIYNGQLYIWPKPKDNKDSVRLLYFSTVTIMSTDTSTCRLPSVWHELVPLVAVEVLKIPDVGTVAAMQTISGLIMTWKRNYVEKVSEKPVPVGQ